ncbi:hypothetical protein ColTof4_13652 [Colletotrichum tofieldiae]|nr:hypothetical protein ColTof3_01900 [Colletotrichum tofieldiae]GKT81229.1 hypothetical protein ColTof4_13652 [Colletotrichum tofieldiae]GKT83902.1 hypothetical protein Ct61P_01752 [Colletotrichum tofieldiae]
METHSLLIEYVRMMKVILKDYCSENARLAAFLSALGVEDHVAPWSKVAERNKGLTKEQTEDGMGGKKRQLPACNVMVLTETEKGAYMRQWYENHIVRVPQVDDDTLVRARSKF